MRLTGRIIIELLARATQYELRQNRHAW